MRRWLAKIHRWAGLAGCAWLLVLGATGIALDHPEWRWLWSTTTPQAWLSKPVGRLLRGTVMRYVVADPTAPEHLLGGSERGLWRTLDAGASWHAVPFEGRAAAPQVFALLGMSAQGLQDVWIATDDGIWRTRDGGARAVRATARGERIDGLSRGATATDVLAIRDSSELLRFEATQPTTPVGTVALDAVRITGLPDTIDGSRLIFDLHFGHGLLGRSASIVASDAAGVALIVLPVTGLLYWLLPRRWQRRRPAAPGHSTQRSIMTWLYRAHGPIVGIVAAIPVLYLAVSGALLTQPEWLQRTWGAVDVPRQWLPPGYRMRSLSGEVTHVVGWPGEPQRLAIATRLGVLQSSDGGRTWQRDVDLPAEATNLFREGELVFASTRAQAHWVQQPGGPWRPLTGPTTALTGATRVDDAARGPQWIVKNSRGFWIGAPDQPFVLTGIALPPLKGSTFFLFAVDLHTGNIFHPAFAWINVAAGILAVSLIASGPILWWRAKWR